jgi:septation ring formation regulator EzrA
VPFTVEEFRDLVRILEERPEWRTELRRLVLTDELLSLPEQMARLRQDTEKGFQELTVQVTTLTARVNELAQAQAYTAERASRLEEAQGRTEERIGRLGETMERLAEAQRRTEDQLSALTAQVTELTRAVYTLTDDVGELKGKSLEADYRTKVFAYFGRLLSRVHAFSPDELTALLDNAIDTRTLSETQAHEISLADVIARGRRREDGAEVYLVVEVLWGVGPEDVERAVHRAEFLARTGATVIPVVAGRWVTVEAAQMARGQRVWQLTDGRIVPPE